MRQVVSEVCWAASLACTARHRPERLYLRKKKEKEKKGEERRRKKRYGNTLETHLRKMSYNQ